MPCVIVTGRSVFSRSVKHGTPSAVVSSCTPPESVTTRRGRRLEREETPVRLRLPTSSTRCGLDPPSSAIRARVRGCTGKSNRELRDRSGARSTRLAQQWARGPRAHAPVQRDEHVAVLLEAEVLPGGRGAGAPSTFSNRVSIIVLPVNATCSAGDALVEEVVDRVLGVVNSSVDRWSATLRLCSSGMVLSKLLSPASRWQTGIWSFTAASAPASVELTSPGTSTRSGCQLLEDLLEADQRLRGLYPMRAGADLEPACGSGSGSSSKKTSLTLRS